MNDDTSGNGSKTPPSTDWKRLRTMTDEEVRGAITADTDIEPTDAAFWKEAKVMMPWLKPRMSD
jgi:hypothetical protein